MHARLVALTVIEIVRPDHLWQSEEWGRVGSILSGRMLEVPRPAEVILRSRAADRRPLIVTVEVELDLPFAPPAGVVDTPGEIRSYVMPLAPHPIEQRVHLLI